MPEVTYMLNWQAHRVYTYCITHRGLIFTACPDAWGEKWHLFHFYRCARLLLLGYEKYIFFPLSPCKWLQAPQFELRPPAQQPASREKKEIFSLLLRSLSSFNIAWESYFFLPKGNTYKFLLFINVWPHKSSPVFALCQSFLPPPPPCTHSPHTQQPRTHFALPCDRRATH